MLGVVVTIKCRMSAPIRCLSHVMLSLRRVSHTAHCRVWRRIIYPSSTSQLVSRHSIKGKKSSKLRHSTKAIVLSLKIMLINIVTPINISLQKLFNKRNQFNQRYADLTEQLNHPWEFFNRGNSNNVRKSDDTLVKSGRQTLSVPKRE